MARLYDAVRFYQISRNRKLSPVRLIRSRDGKKKLKVEGPFCAATYVSIEATCPNSCPFKNGGCYVPAGFTHRTNAMMDGAAIENELTGDQVIAMEADWVNRSFPNGVPQDGALGGRDLRYHVGGDVSSTWGAKQLGAAAEGYIDRGGGSVWTFTHRWRQIAKESWGLAVSVLASVESVEDAYKAKDRGYAPAIVVAGHRSHKLYEMGGRKKLKVIPCPAETTGTTCVKCRLCLDRDLLSMGVAIGFRAHGRSAGKVRLALMPTLPGLEMNRG